MTQVKEGFMTWDDPAQSICEKCGELRPVMFDCLKFNDDIGGRWENPERIFWQIRDPKYLQVACDCKIALHLIEPATDAPLPDMLERIEALEAMVKRIAAHLVIEG